MYFSLTRAAVRRSGWPSLILTALALLACKVNVENKIFKTGDASDHGQSGSIYNVGTLIVMPTHDKKATLIIEKIAIKSEMDKAVSGSWKMESIDYASIVSAARIKWFRDYYSYYYDGSQSRPSWAPDLDNLAANFPKAPAYQIKLSGGVRTGEYHVPAGVVKPVIILYLRNGGDEPATIHGARTRTVLFSDGGAGGSEPILPLNKDTKLTFSYDKDGDLDFRAPISVPSHETCAIELELDLDDASPQDGSATLTYQLLLRYHDGAEMRTEKVAYFKQDEALE